MTYHLDRSTQFVVWQVIATNVAPASGLLLWLDTFTDLPGKPDRAYYRVRRAP